VRGNVYLKERWVEIELGDEVERCLWKVGVVVAGGESLSGAEDVVIAMLDWNMTGSW